MIRSDLALVATQFVAQLRRLTRAPRAGDVDATIRAEVARLGPEMRRLAALELTPEETARWIA
jgi:hypothetical protein